MSENLQYFGTNTREHGHFRFTVDKYGLTGPNLRFNDLPFDPERLTNNMSRGETAFYQGGGFTVLAIAGSPVDTRPGTKSVFFIKQLVSMEDFVEIIENNDVCMHLIRCMPFPVKVFRALK